MIAGVAFEPVTDSVLAVTHGLLVGTPVLLLLLAWVTWLVVGYTLRPISALRRGAQVVTATGQPRELPVPEARDEVHDLAVTLNDMLARLDAAQQRQRDLVSDTAHELRSPIASIRTQLEVALDHPEQQDWTETASDVLADTLRLARLAEDLLVLARLDERGTPAAAGRRPVDLSALVTEEAERSAGAPGSGDREHRQPLRRHRRPGRAAPAAAQPHRKFVALRKVRGRCDGAARRRGGGAHRVR